MMSQTLFVYGTLMAPEVIQALIGRLPPSCPARLSGYVRHPVRNQMYPGLIPCIQQAPSSNDASSCTMGVLYSELSDTEMKRLDWFEDTDYTRTTVQVTPATASPLTDKVDSTLQRPKQETHVYVFSNPVEQLDTSRDWSLEEFREQHLEQFLSRTVRPCRDELDRLKYC